MIGDLQKSGVQTSFIPKKPLVSYEQKDKPGIFAIINFVSIIIFVVAVSVYGGGLFYRTFLNNSISSITGQLDKVQADLKDRDSQMKDMIKLDKKIKNVSLLLDKHITLRNLFSLLEQKTMSNLRFSQFSLSSKEDGLTELNLQGEASSYGTIALQVREFLDSKTFGVKDFSDVIFSDFNPGPTGNVVFKANAKISPELVYYKNLTLNSR